MNLLELRKQFINISGRYDLIVSPDDYTDNGANFYINSGLSHLDNRINYSGQETVSLVRLSKGESLIAWNLERRINKVCINGNPLTAVQTLNKAASIGRPTKFSINSITYNPKLTEEYLEQIGLDVGKIDKPICDAVDANALILFDVKADIDYGVDVYETNYPHLTFDTDECWWSRKYPITVIKAAMYELEVSYRNNEGAGAWLNALEIDIRHIDKDSVEDELQNFDGEWGI